MAASHLHGFTQPARDLQGLPGDAAGRVVLHIGGGVQQAEARQILFTGDGTGGDLGQAPAQRFAQQIIVAHQAHAAGRQQRAGAVEATLDFIHHHRHAGSADLLHQCHGGVGRGRDDAGLALDGFEEQRGIGVEAFMAAGDLAIDDGAGQDQGVSAGGNQGVRRRWIGTQALPVEEGGLGAAAQEGVAEQRLVG